MEDIMEEMLLGLMVTIAKEAAVAAVLVVLVKMLAEAMEVDTVAMDMIAI
jgi:hypothetical protein